MVGTRASCQPMPVLKMSTPALASRFASSSVSSHVCPSWTRSAREMRYCSRKSAPTSWRMRRTISTGSAIRRRADPPLRRFGVCGQRRGTVEQVAPTMIRCRSPQRASFADFTHAGWALMSQRPRRALNGRILTLPAADRMSGTVRPEWSCSTMWEPDARRDLAGCHPLHAIIDPAATASPRRWGAAGPALRRRSAGEVGGQLGMCECGPLVYEFMTTLRRVSGPPEATGAGTRMDTNGVSHFRRACITETVVRWWGPIIGS